MQASMSSDNIHELVQPNSVSRFIEEPGIFVEQTLTLIKPDAVHKADEIEDIILRSGFAVVHKRKVHLTPEQVSDFYADHYGKLFFPSLVAYMSSGPIVALVLARNSAISFWHELVGPTNAIKARQTHPDSLRAIYGTDESRNALHASLTFSQAAHEIHFFFPGRIVEPVKMDKGATDYMSRAINPTLLKGLTALCKEKPQNPIIWLADWLIDNNPNKPTIGEPTVMIA